MADSSQRKPGQGGAADLAGRDLRAQLLEAEAVHFAKTKGSGSTEADQKSEAGLSSKRQLEAPGQDGDIEEDMDAKRRRILEETRDIDADSKGSDSESSDEERLACGPIFADSREAKVYQR
jgi:protein CWC15